MRKENSDNNTVLYLLLDGKVFPIEHTEFFYSITFKIALHAAPCKISTFQCYFLPAL